MIKNLTTRDIKIITETGEKIYWPKGHASVKTIVTQVGEFEGVKITKTSFGEIVGLPPEKEGVIYIVSQITAKAARIAGRVDCFVPTEAILNESGQVIGYKSIGIVE